MNSQAATKSSGSSNSPAKARRREKQRWPFIKTRLYPSGAKAWIVDARTKTGGERKTFETLTEAETFAEQCRVRRTNEGTAAFGNSELARYGKTVQDAISFYLEHLRREEKSLPISDAIKELVETRKGSGQSVRYCHDLELRLGRFQRAFGARGTASVTGKELDEWLAGLPVAPGTRNTFRRDLRTLFSFCVKRGYASSNPATATELAKDVGQAPGILTVAEAAKLLERSGNDVLPYVAIGMFAGLRSAELEKLDWSEIDLSAGLIEVKAHKAKTARRRLVRIEPALKAWLEPLALKAGPVIPEALRYRMDDAKRAAGFGTPGTETDKEKKAGVKLKEWPQNALRHTFGSYWLAKHQDAAALALQMGNSAQMVFAHYRELVRPVEAERFWNLKPAPAGKKIVAMRAV